MSDNLHLLLDARKNEVTMAKEKAEVLNASFISVFYNKTNSQSIQYPELEGRYREQKDSP